MYYESMYIYKTSFCIQEFYEICEGKKKLISPNCEFKVCNP